ncbi:MAG: hypothetical protein IJ764_02770 [Bacteroidales bacterium]|nr:hypothetical protein [Bacteroidales bacterium]
MNTETEINNKSITVPDNIEDYIAKGIKDYRWSDEFLVKDLSRFGIEEEEAKRLIAKVKEERHVSNKESFVDDDNGDDEVHGWVRFVLITIGLGGIISFLYPLIQQLSQPQIDNSLLGWSDAVEGALFLVLAIYAIVQMAKKRPNGVFLMKSYLIVCFVSNLLGIILYDNGDGSDFFYNLPRMRSTTIWTAIWYTFLCVSPQIKRLFPKEKRKVKRVDKWLVASFLLIPIAIVIMSVLIDVSGGSSVNKDNLQRYINKVSSWNLPKYKGTELAYDRDENCVSIKQTIPVEDVYLNNTSYIATLKNMGEFLSESSVAILSGEAMNVFDSLIGYFDAANANLSYTLCLPDSTIILKKHFEYDYISNIDDDAFITYNNETTDLQIATANSICPFELEEGLWCKSVQYEKESHLVEYTYQILVDTPWMGDVEYNQLLKDISETLPLESLKSRGLIIRLFLNDKGNNQLANIEY